MLDVLSVGTDGLARAGGFVVDFGELGHFVGEFVVVLDPVLAAAVEERHVVVAVVLELPICVGGEPVGVVTVEDDCGVLANSVISRAGPRSPPS